MFYHLISPTAEHTPALIDFCSGKPGRSHEGVRRRLFDYFVLNEGDGRFLNHTTVVAQAQDGLSADLVRSADFLEGVAGPPIFSAAFVAATRAELADELEFHRCVVRCQGAEFDGFFVAKVMTYLPLIDPERSRFVTLDSGTALLAQPAAAAAGGPGRRPPAAQQRPRPAVSR